ncbi:MAG: ornithine cyclodeaminase [Gammaproteobacteria bacterium]|nr:ornithine cyclodeaminase [Gammaproteobacteria bacterium]
MVKVITLSDIKKLINTVGVNPFFQALILSLEKEFSRWDRFDKSPRHAVHTHDGVIELMPTADDEFYTFKYVNGHPSNPKSNKLTVVAVGLLSDVNNGYPLLLSEMTVLTALRTAATSALASKYLAKKDSKIMGIIGTGAQSEFQILALKTLFPVETVKYFDIDSEAMKKFEINLNNLNIKLIACDDAVSVVEDCDIITTATAAKGHVRILESQWIKPGMHINAIGGDCPGKTELDKNILPRAKIVIEYFPQSKIEGEIQQSDAPVYAELWELTSGKKPGRLDNAEITLFDSVGFALEDFVILKFIYALATENNIGTEMDLIPNMPDPKNLFGLL